MRYNWALSSMTFCVSIALSAIPALASGERCFNVSLASSQKGKYHSARYWAASSEAAWAQAAKDARKYLKERSPNLGSATEASGVKKEDCRGFGAAPKPADNTAVRKPVLSPGAKPAAPAKVGAKKVKKRAK